MELTLINRMVHIHCCAVQTMIVMKIMAVDAQNFLQSNISIALDFILFMKHETMKHTAGAKVYGLWVWMNVCPMFRFICQFQIIPKNIHSHSVVINNMDNMDMVYSFVSISSDGFSTGNRIACMNKFMQYPKSESVFIKFIRKTCDINAISIGDTKLQTSNAVEAHFFSNFYLLCIEIPF